MNGTCPLGCICNQNLSEVASCLSIQKKTVDLFKFGDVLGGIYCAEGAKTIENCDVGFYCPDPSTKLPCPAKFFCPHKTRVPSISCSACSEGSTRLARPLWGFLVIIISFCAIFMYILTNYFIKYQKDLKTRISSLSTKFVINLEEKMRQRLLNRVQEKLEAIQKNCQCDDILLVDSHGILTFDDELLFEKLDLDESGDLSYNELNEFLDLKSGQLLEFINYMNERGGVPRGEKTVRKEIFQTYFLDALEHSMNFDPTDEIADQLFDDILENLGYTSSNEIRIDKFQESCLSDFLTESEILNLQKKFYRLNKIMNFDEESKRESSVSSLRRLNRNSSNFIDFGQIEKNIALKLEEYTDEKRLFVQCCLDAIEENIIVDSSDKELEQTLIEITDNDVEGSIESSINLDGLHKTGLSKYCNDSQINMLIDQYRGLLNLKRDKVESEIYPIVPSTKYGRKTTKSVRKTTKSVRKRSSVIALPKLSSVPKKEWLTREIFCQFYAIFLREIQQQKGISNYCNNEDSFNLSFEHLSLHVFVKSKKKTVVDNVTGTVKGRSLTALMGGSGVGKTSLLNALCGRAYYGEVTGDIFINGHKASINDHKSIVGFVPQDDIVYPELTVKENFIFAGKFKLPAGTPTEEIVELAEETMANLGLTRVADSMVGNVDVRGVSGGERKRVNIGVELMSCPRILFLDEPTSGLDSSSALLVMKSLRGLIDTNNITICSVIHQPRRSVFELFDKVLILGHGGKMIYHGDISNIENYFSNLHYELPVAENVADWILDIGSGSLDPLFDDGKSDNVTIRGLPSTSLHGNSPDLHVAGKVSRAIQRAQLNSMNLARNWEKYMVQSNHFEESVKQDLPSARNRPNFYQQLLIQLHRNMIVMYRQRSSKLTTMLSLLLIMLAICALDGPVLATEDLRPNISFEFDVLTSNDPVEFSSSFFQLFKYAFTVKEIPGFAMKVGIVMAVVLALSAGHNFNDKRLEFFREAASGYDVNAYYLALHITTFLELEITMLMTAIASLWLRVSLSKGLNFILNFLSVGWLIIAWGLLFPLFVPPKNVTIVTGLSMAFAGIQFTGQLEPLTFKKIYADNILAVFVAFVCPIRYFVEQMGIIEQRALPAQSGFTQVATEDSSNFPKHFNSFNLIGTAQKDINTVSVQSFYGWNWPFLRVFLVGLTLRVFSFGILHICNRSLQNKKPLLTALMENQTPRKWLLYMISVIAFCALFAVTVYTILN